MPQNTVRTIEECVGKPMLALVDYFLGGNGPVAFVYPRYLRQAEGFVAIDVSAFPDLGNIVVRVPVTSNIEDRIGDLAVALLRNAEGVDNPYYPQNPSKYAVSLPDSPRQTATFSLTRLSDHVMYNEIMQIIEAKEDVNPSNATDAKLTITPVTGIPTSKYVLLETVVGASIFYWGPFEYTPRASGELDLTAADEYDYRLARVNASQLPDHLAIRDHKDPTYVVAKFMPTSAFVPEMRRSSTKLDWIGRQKLVDAVGHVLQSIDDAGFSKNMRRRIKTAIGVCSEETARLKLTADRKRKLEEVLSDIEYFQDLPARLKEQIVSNVSEEALSKAALSDTTLPVVQKMLERNADVTRLVDAEREKAARLIDSFHNQAEEARTQRDEALREAEDAKRAAKEIQQRAIDERKAEIAELDESVSRLRAAEEEARDELRKATEDKERLAGEVSKIVEELHDEVALSADILKRELLRKVIAGVTGGTDGLRWDQAAHPFSTLRADESELSGREVADTLVGIVNDQAGRDYTTNEVINFFVCLAQSLITTFAGLPGTGKTSLCRILAGALGLLNEANPPRFCEIAVENGWTSYRDYIGYHNPLTRRYEVADPAVFSAFSRLSAEAREATAASVPFLFLLDEANLSPMEHYWSPFLHATDTALERGCRLALGGEQDLLVPAYARFLASVNFDHTTEALSPRFLDRSWVITLEARTTDFELDEGEVDFDPSQTPAFSYSRLMEVFGGTQATASVEQTLTDAFRDVVKICLDARRPISQRSQKMIMRYLNAASPLMDTETADSRYAPLDFALTQKVLPLLAGPTEDVSDVLVRLGERCADLPMTRRKLASMREMGEGSGFVQFFA